MTAFVIVLFAHRNCQCQPIFLGRQGASCIRRDRAGRIVSAVEVERDRAVCCRLSVEKASTRIGVGLAREITENEKQTRLGILAQICQPNLLTIELEHGRAGTGVGVTSPSTFGTSTVLLPSAGSHFAITR